MVIKCLKLILLKLLRVALLRSICKVYKNFAAYIGYILVFLRTQNFFIADNFVDYFHSVYGQHRK